MVIQNAADAGVSAGSEEENGILHRLPAVAQTEGNSVEGLSRITGIRLRRSSEEVSEFFSG